MILLFEVFAVLFVLVVAAAIYFIVIRPALRSDRTAIKADANHQAMFAFITELRAVDSAGIPCFPDDRARETATILVDDYRKALNP